MTWFKCILCNLDDMFQNEMNFGDFHSSLLVKFIWNGSLLFHFFQINQESHLVMSKGVMLKNKVKLGELTSERKKIEMKHLYQIRA